MPIPDIFLYIRERIETLRYQQSKVHTSSQIEREMIQIL